MTAITSQTKTATRFAIVLITILLSASVVMPASATSPPYESLVTEMVPVSHDANNYFSENQPVCPDEAYNRTTYTWDVLVPSGQPGAGRFASVAYPYPSDEVVPAISVSPVRGLSGYWRAENYWDPEEGNALIAVTGYYDDRTAFTRAKDNLREYLDREGTITAESVNLEGILRNSGNPCLREMNSTVDAIRDQSPYTAGYFLFHDKPDFSGDLYRIEYLRHHRHGHERSGIQPVPLRAGYGRQGTANLSDADNGIRALIVTRHFNLVGTKAESYTTFNSTMSPGPDSVFFPALSPYHAGAMHVFLPTGKRFVSEAWVFIDADVFDRQRSELFRYLNETGNVSTTSLEFSGERGLTGIWNVTRYESRNTSGYFFTSTRAILYDGVVGPADLQENSYPIQLLIADTTIPAGYTGRSIPLVRYRIQPARPRLSFLVLPRSS